MAPVRVIATKSPTGPARANTWPAVLKAEVPITAEIMINYIKANIMC
jgi:hypothetical protein